MKKRQMTAALMAGMMVFVMTGSTQVKAEAVEPDPYVTDDTLDHSLPYFRTCYGKEYTTILNIGGTGNLPEGQTVDNNVMLDNVTKVTGAVARIDWAAENDGYVQKQNACIATGDIPDLMEVNFNQYKQLVKAGLIADMTDAIEELSCPVLADMYESNPMLLDSLEVGGRIYGIPRTAAIGDVNPLVWIRKDWLDKLGLEEPTCLRDLEEIALAFMEQDPDGNGKDDTYGIPFLTSYYGEGGGALASIIMNAGNGAAPGCWLVQDDGTVVRGEVMDGVKDGLIFLNDWYQKGIIPADFATWDGNMASQAVANDKAGITVAAWWDCWGGVGNNVTMNKDAVWNVYALPLDEGGTYYGQPGTGISSIYVVNKDYDEPEMFVRMYNLLYSTQMVEDTDGSLVGYVPMKMGVSANNMKAWADGFIAWDNGEVHSTEDFVNVLAGEGVVSDLPVATDSFPLILPCMEAENPRDGEAQGGNYQYYLGYDLALKAMFGADPTWVSTQYLGTPDSYAKYATFLEDLRNESYTKMIMGDTDGQSISDYFDSFVEQYLSQGGAEATAEVQAEIDAR